MDGYLQFQLLNGPQYIFEGKNRCFGPFMKHLLILDGHKSHVNLEVVEKARRKSIDMITLLSHTSHELQPLDLSCFNLSNSI